MTLRRGRRRTAGRAAAVAVDYAAAGWPVCLGTHLRGGQARHSLHGAVTRGRALDPGRACSCDRIGCPAPGAHPISPAWQLEASGDPREAGRWWRERPEANIILVTGRVFDVLDVPAAAGTAALAQMQQAGVRAGPVAQSAEALPADDRALFFVTTRGAPADEDEWWSCHLDCEPDDFAPVTGLRWHTRGSFVVAPPSRYGRGVAHWIREPGEHPLPDALRLLEFLADACEEVGA
ncbi:MAG TPA: bifunctional DNA primase/polymerase [Streptosporangiaceae bacterium]|nr:bifunctional DNA primase/polymerase [Streptosporangiaceae bacterium]